MGTAAVRKPRGRARKSTKLKHVSVCERDTLELRPSPENDRLYRPVNPNDPEILKLAESIREHGVMEPLVVTLDGYIVSGHRRFVAAEVAGLEKVPVRVLQINRCDDIDRFIRLLREHNRQRDKTLDEKLREELVSINPDEAYQELIAHRREESFVDVDGMDITGAKRRCEISSAKEPMLKAILNVIKERRRYWPLSDRRIHYALLNDPPLKHAGKRKSRYANDRKSYQALVELLTRARLVGRVPWSAIADSTRPVVLWKVFTDPRAFVRREMNDLLKGYARDLMQSQPNHIELVGEKNTVAPLLREVASEFTIPLTIGRGYCSVPPRYEMAQRFHRSGKEKLILLIVSDFDPDGEEIAHSFARSMRDDFDIRAIHPIKVALTAEQVEEYDLPPVMTAKETSVHYDKFVESHGDNVWELEALDESDLQEILRETIDSVIDIDKFNAEQEAEKADSAWLAGARNTVHEALKGIDTTKTES